MNIKIISDFNTDTFANLLSNHIENANIKSMAYGQVYQNLINVINDGNKDAEYDTDFLIIWTRAESIFPEYQKAIEFKDINIELLNSEFEEFSSIIQKCSKVVKNILFFSWVKPPQNHLHGMLDYKLEGPQYLINHLNNRMSEAFLNSGNIHILNTNDIILSSGFDIFDNQMNFLIKVPYKLEFLEVVSKNINSCIEGVLGKSRRVLVLDLDNTLWGGILGDDGIDGIRIGGHDALGEAFLSFQKAIKTLKNRGVALAIASKNYEENAIHALENNQEMYLKKDDFSTWRINWIDKATNIAEIAKDLNLGLSSLVFIDDNPVERGRVSETLPEVYVPEWPESPFDYTQALLELDCFNVPTVSEEDKKRVEMFAAEKSRIQLKDSLSHDDWLKSIGISVEVENINKNNNKRIIQLLNKSNQFNAITRRFSEVELDQWLEDDSRYCWAYRVSDKYGESGLTAIIIFEIKDDYTQVFDFVMSCRVMGRNIENIILKTVIDFSAQQGSPEVRVNYIESDRNKPIREFLEDRSDFTQSDNVFIWDVQNPYHDYSYINVINNT